MGENVADSQRVIGYPAKDDVEWVAVDRHGRVGIFTTGGDGPIPRAYLQAPGSLARIHDAIGALPERSAAVLVSRVPRPDDFLAFARRGCFTFDWIVAHQLSEHSSHYELQAFPRTALAFIAIEWPEDLRSLLERVQSESLDFDQRMVDVSVLDCEHGSERLPSNDR